MSIVGVISDRKIFPQKCFQIVYEWEDIICSQMPLPLHVKGVWIDRIFRYVSKTKISSALFLFFAKIFFRKKYYLFFRMEPNTQSLRIDCLNNIIPIIIDFWLTKNQLEDFYKHYARSKVMLITSKEVYQFLLDNKCLIPLVHYPLSLPDGNFSSENLNCPKEFTFLFPGRKDSVFFEYMLEYEKSHPEIEYVYQKFEGDDPYYVSNKKGRLDADFSVRENYLSLLKHSKVTFYSTPGMDNKTKQTNGFNPVTPRFLELLSCGCLVMGRYPVNPDTEFYEMEKYCPRVNTYEDFEKTLNLFFDEEWAKNHISTYNSYLKKHTTSSRNEILIKLSNQL